MQDNAGQQFPPGFWCGVAGGFVQGPHMAYSLALDAKSFAFCYCCRIVRTVIFIFHFVLPCHVGLLVNLICKPTYF